MSALEEEFNLQLKAHKAREGVHYEREYRFAPPRKFRADFAFVREQILVEIEGGVWINGRHNRAASFIKDCEKYNLATMKGWALLRFTREHIKSGEAIEQTLALINQKDFEVEL